jgi:hypothetical protein
MEESLRQNGWSLNQWVQQSFARNVAEFDRCHKRWLDPFFEEDHDLVA